MKNCSMFRIGVFGLASLAGTASAFELPHICQKDRCAETQRVVLPQRQVEVVTERPRVIVREAPSREIVSRVRSFETRGMLETRGVAAVGTIYMPMVGVDRGATQVVREEYNPFESAHRAQLAVFRAEMAKMELQRSVEIQRKLLDCFSSTGTGASGTDSAVEAKLALLKADLDKIGTRLTDVEKLLLYHDNLLQKKEKPETKPQAIELVPMPPEKKQGALTGVPILR